MLLIYTTNYENSEFVCFHKMDRRKESFSSGVEDDETRSVFSMQELDPSPVDDLPPDLEGGDYFPKTEVDSTNVKDFSRLAIPKLGLSGHRWDYWCKSSTLPSHDGMAYRTEIPILTLWPSIRTPKIFHLFSDYLFRSPPSKHLSHSACNTLHIFQRILPLVDKTCIPIPIPRTCRLDDSYPYAYHFGACTAMYSSPA